jgi:hypothetical protein
MPTRRLVLPLLACLIGGVFAPLARANNQQLSVMMDDDQLVYRGDKTRDKALDKMAALGVDYVRVTVLWSVVAQGAQDTKAERKRFRKLGADNPKAYPKGNWDRYDNLVRSAEARGIGVYFNVTGPGPSWGHQKAPRSEARNQSTWMPKPREFKLFVEAVGKRFSGKYRDENFHHQKLPRVGFWSLWNEPNQGGWLTPQWYHGKPYSPVMFRSLYFAGYQGLVATGHNKDIILAGETAPLGSNGRTERSPMYPGVFIRALFCVNKAGQRASGTGCSDFTRNGPLLATAWAHHPYTKHLSPTQPDPNPDAFTIANLGSLTDLLDKIAKNTGRIADQEPLALTEYGYETNPPDPFQGISLAKQADYLQLGDLITYLNPRVITQTQFLLRDVPPLSKYTKGTKHYWFTYQSGLYFANGKPKPAAAAYAFPFQVASLGPAADGQTNYGVWGQLRWRPNHSSDPVFIQFKPKDNSTGWTTLGDAIVAGPPRNYFTGQREVPGPGQLRAVWIGSDAPKVAISRPATVG